MTKLVLATKNLNKAEEIKKILAALKVTLFTLKDYPSVIMPEEDAPDFAGNAAKKAAAVASQTNEISLADDSGLEVEALGGRPGVHSARYAGPKATDASNNLLLLQELAGLAPEKRKARFVTVIAICVPPDQIYYAKGTCSGLITEAPRGRGGFGYDPLFLYEPAGLSFAEMTAEEKNKVSHRAKALEEARRILLKIIKQDCEA